MTPSVRGFEECTRTKLNARFIDSEGEFHPQNTVIQGSFPRLNTKTRIGVIAPKHQDINHFIAPKHQDIQVVKTQVVHLQVVGATTTVQKSSLSTQAQANTLSATPNRI